MSRSGGSREAGVTGLICEIDGKPVSLRAEDLSTAGFFIETTTPYAMDRELEKHPGAFWNFSQPIEDNVDETMTGTKGGLCAKLYGPDLDVLEEKGEEIQNVMAKIDGVKDLGVQRDTGQPNIDLTVDRLAAARFGINVTDVQDAIETAVGGNAVSQVLDGERRFDLVPRYEAEYRDTREAIENVR